MPIKITCERRWLTFKCLQTKASEWVADRDKLNQTTTLSIQTLLVAKYKHLKNVNTTKGRFKMVKIQSLKQCIKQHLFQ